MTTMHRDDLPVLKELLSQTVDPIEVISVSFSLRAVKVNMAITIYCTFYTSTLFCLDCRLTLNLPRRMDGTVDVNRGLLSPLITLHATVCSGPTVYLRLLGRIFWNIFVLGYGLLERAVNRHLHKFVLKTN